jgi:hypothetical protein
MRIPKTDIPATPVKNLAKNNKTEKNKDAPVTHHPVRKEPPKESSVQKARPSPPPAVPQKTIDTSKTLGKNPTLIMKSGATDLRRGAKQLRVIAKDRMGQDLLDGNMHAFANKPRTTVKVVQAKKDGATLLTKYFKEHVD